MIQMTDNTPNTESYTPMNKEPKNRKPLIICLLVILGIAFLGAAGFGIYTFIEKKKVEAVEDKKKQEQAKKDKEENNLEILDNDSPAITSFFETYTSSITNPCGIDDYFALEKITSKDISNDKMFSMMSNDIFKDKNKAIVAVGDSFTEDELNNKIVKFFGKDYKFTHNSIKDCINFTYDQVKKVYVVSSASTCAITCPYPNLKKVTKAQSSKDLFVLSVRVLFSDGKGNYYKDYGKKKLLTDLVADDTGRYDTNESNFSQGSLYKMRFVKEDDHYVFESSELMEDA